MSSRTQLIRETSTAMTRVMYGFRYAFGQAAGQKATTLQIQALSLIRLNPRSSAKEIGDSLYLSSSATTQLIQRLVDASMIQRENDPADRRSVNLSLTKKGEAVLRDFGTKHAEKYYRIFEVLTDDELKAFTSALTKLHLIIQEQKNNDDK